MNIKRIHLGENMDHKMEVKMKSLDDRYMTENRKNRSQETNQTLCVEEAKCTTSIFWRSKKVWLGAAVMMVALAGIGAGVALASAPHILHQIGFTSKGLARKSFASRLMSSTSKANNHTVPKDSWVSWLQTAGQKGLTAEHQTYFATGGAIVGVVAAVVVVVVVILVVSCVRRLRQKS